MSSPKFLMKRHARAALKKFQESGTVGMPKVRGGAVPLTPEVNP